MATFRKRGDKWQARIQLKGFAQVSMSFATKADAEAWAKITESEMIRGAFIKRTEVERVTLAELLDRYESEVSATKRGAKAEGYRLAQFRRSELAPLAVGSITGAHIAKWRDARLKEVSSGTALRDMQLLGHVFTMAIQEWGIPLPCNPVEQVRKPSAGKARSKVLTDAERVRLLYECGQCKSPWVRPTVLFALETGARRGEILALEWNDVDLDRSIACVDGKTGPRVIPLTPTCVTLLRALPRSLDGLVFPISIETLKQAYERAVARAGLENWTFHDCRHDALTRFAKKGLNILELRAISGHTTANMLQRYVAIDPIELARKLG